MSKVLQIRGGSSAEHTNFIGQLREITVDTSKKTLVVHDGVTAGGYELAKKSDIDSTLELVDGLSTAAVTIKNNIATINTNKADKSTTLAGYGITDAAFTTHTHSNATTTVTGFMSPTDKTKLDGKVNALASGIIDLSLGNYFTKTITAATTLSLTNILVGPNINNFILELTNGIAGVVTWFSGIKWSGGIAPTLSTTIDIFHFFSYDGGTTWKVSIVTKDGK